MTVTELNTKQNWTFQGVTLHIHLRHIRLLTSRKDANHDQCLFYSGGGPCADSTMDQPESWATAVDQSRPPAANRPQSRTPAADHPSLSLQWCPPTTEQPQSQLPVVGQPRPWPPAADQPRPRPPVADQPRLRPSVTDQPQSRRVGQFFFGLIPPQRPVQVIVDFNVML